MKKIIILLCLVMFMCVNAKHYSKNDNNPNASVFLKVTFSDQKGNKAKKNNTGIYKVDGVSLNKGFISTFYETARIEPGLHEITIHHGRSGGYANPKIKYDFKENETYIITVFADDSQVNIKILDNKETE